MSRETVRKQLRSAARALRAARRIMITGHKNPDGDSLGSLLALGLALTAAGKDVQMICCDPVPHAYRSLPGVRNLAKRLTRGADVAVVVDSGSPDVLGKARPLVFSAPVIIEIDHHDVRTPFGTVSVIDTEAAAVAEIVWRLLGELGLPITEEISRCLLAALIVETNSFRLPSVRAATFRMCAALVAGGVDFAGVADAVYWSRTRQSLMLSGLCLSRCRFRAGGKLVWSTVSRSDFGRLGGKDYDVDPVANEMLTMKGVEVAVLFREVSPGRIRVSIRSKGCVNVAEIAQRFGGGGHVEMAGCQLRGTRSARHRFLRAAESAVIGLPVTI